MFRRDAYKAFLDGTTKYRTGRFMTEEIPDLSTSQTTNAELFELLIESSTDVAIFTTDPQGLATTWNIGAERLFGFSETEILRTSADVIFTPEDRDAGAPLQERLSADASGRAIDERWHQRKDGSRFWASGLMMPLKNSAGYVKITRDRTEQHLADERIGASEERFRVLATNIPQLVFRTRPTGERTWPSPQWIDFTGQSFDESLSLGWLDAIHPDDRGPTRLAWEEAQRTGEYYAEHRVWRKAEGGYRWHQTRARPTGSPFTGEWVGTMTDIHDLRGYQDRQQVLLTELQHRTRNLLAVVQAIASRTMRKATSIEAFAADFEGRLRAMSRVQGILTRFDHGAVDLQSLVEAELAAHTETEPTPGKIEITGQAVNLPASSAQTLGLGLHELLTNAEKYGALSQPGGRLAIRWTLEAADREPTLRFEWRESGVAMPAGGGPARRGYGSELLERALAYQLHAKTALEFGPDGVICVIEVPVRADAPQAPNG